KKDRKGYLGVNIEDVTRRLAERKDLVTKAGAYVTSVVDNSAAEDAGIKKGDVILKYDGKEVEDSDELTDMVRKTKPGTTVDIVVERKKETKTLKAEIDRLDSPSAFSFDFDDFGVTTPKPHLNVRPRVQVYSSGSSMYGLAIQSLSKQLAEYFEVPGKKGALVTEVKKNSDADKAGFKAGDVITKIGSVSVWDVNDVREELQDAEEGDELSIEVIRKGKSSTLKMKIEEGDDEDDWSYHYVPNGSGYHYFYNDKLSKDIEKDIHLDVQRDALRELQRSLRENLKDGLNDTKRELRKIKENLRNELRKL
ncbi:MAG: PDZ domain-containing protein, partial [Bacteroidetes bacterium]